MNPRACHETDRLQPPLQRGALPSERASGAGFRPRQQSAHQVTLFDGASEIGGQFNMAKKIPGKEEFHETLVTSVDALS